MDLTRFLRNRSNSDNPASPNPAGSLMPPPQPSGALSSASSEEDNDPSLKNSRYTQALNEDHERLTMKKQDWS
jgi:hypothetical protein